METEVVRNAVKQRLLYSNKKKTFGRNIGQDEHIGFKLLCSIWFLPLSSRGWNEIWLSQSLHWSNWTSVPRATTSLNNHQLEFYLIWYPGFQGKRNIPNEISSLSVLFLLEGAELNLKSIQDSNHFQSRAPEEKKKILPLVSIQTQFHTLRSISLTSLVFIKQLLR